MRLWTLHPRYLDARGLVALWREALLAQAVLRGRTTGYMHHPQLARFECQTSPLGALGDYLRAVHGEAARRGYRFASRRVSRARGMGPITVTRGQLDYEWSHLLAKLAARDRRWRDHLAGIARPRAHPLFRIVPGRVESWERGGASRS
jgi:Pyrimidine dimer DNA glycosylase